MEYLLTLLKVIVSILTMFVGVSFWLNGLTGWGDHGQIKKLWVVSGVVSVILVASYYLIFS